MKKQSPSFEAESPQPDYVRDLLDAGRDAGLNDPAVRGYDVEAGLARHMAQVQAGAPLPPWAEQLVASSSGAAIGAATAAKIATSKLVAGVALAVIAAGTIAALVIGAPEKSALDASRPVPGTPVEPIGAPASKGDQAALAPQPEAREGGDAVELEIAPIISRAKRDAHSSLNGERAADVEPKPASAQNAKSLDALMEAVGKQQRSGSTSSKGHVDLVPPRGTVARTESQANVEQAQESDRSDQSATAAATPAPAPVVDDARLEREMGMLAVAQRVLKTDPERALRLARQGEQEFAGSMFTQERQQVLLLALIELGRIGEAKRLALPYLKRYPNGPFSDRLRGALAAAKPEN